MVLDTSKKKYEDTGRWKNNKWFKKKEKIYRNIFSSWVNLFYIERICVKSLTGFQLRWEQCFLVYTVQLLEIN